MSVEAVATPPLDYRKKIQPRSQGLFPGNEVEKNHEMGLTQYSLATKCLFCAKNETEIKKHQQQQRHFFQASKLE